MRYADFARRRCLLVIIFIVNSIAPPIFLHDRPPFFLQAVLWE